MTTAAADTVCPYTEAERRRALGEVYAYLLTLAARRRAQTTTNTTTESDHDDDRQRPQ